MTEETDVVLKDLSILVEKEWEKRLREFVRLERCRSLREMIIYFLEVMLAVARQKPNLQLTLEDSVELFKGHLRSVISGELYQSLVEKAGEYGIKVSDLIRIFLSMALNFLAPRISSCLKKIGPPPQWVMA